MESVDNKPRRRLPQLLWSRKNCPLCGSIEFKQAEARPADRLFVVFALFPVRCVNCWRRYYQFAAGV